MIAELLHQLTWKIKHFLVGINEPLTPPLFELQVGLLELFLEGSLCRSFLRSLLPFNSIVSCWFPAQKDLLVNAIQ